MIFEAERSSDEAENALLKTFEEPPPSTVILLVTSSPDELDTTRSRCQRIDLAPLDEAAIVGGADRRRVTTNPRRARGAARGRAARTGACARDDRRALRDAFLDALDRSTARVHGGHGAPRRSAWP